MTRDEIQLLFEYNRWANRRVLRAVSALSHEQFTRELGGGFLLRLLDAKTLATDFHLFLLERARESKARD